MKANILRIAVGVAFALQASVSSADDDRVATATAAAGSSTGLRAARVRHAEIKTAGALRSDTSWMRFRGRLRGIVTSNAGFSHDAEEILNSCQTSLCERLEERTTQATEALSATPPTAD